MRHPERFDPRDGEGSLIDTEHRARYWWASRVVRDMRVLDAGCGVGYGIEILAAGAASVTGLDVDPEAVEEARIRFGAAAEEIVRGDLRELPFDDASFDAVTCFETIEHIEDGARALAELRRVLKAEGLLLISSPNPDVYPPGNEHHVHEYRPEELAAAVGEHFARVERYRQHAWLASAIEPAAKPATRQRTMPGERNGHPELRRTASLGPGEETYGIVAATDEGALPGGSEAVALGDAFEVGWWSAQIESGRAEGEHVAEEARRHIEAAREETREAIATAEEQARAHGAEVEADAQRAIAQSAEREGAAARRLRASAEALVDANRELAQVPALKHRMALLEEEHKRVCGLYSEIYGSRSWRLTAPLRRLRPLFGTRD